MGVSPLTGKERSISTICSFGHNKTIYIKFNQIIFDRQFYANFLTFSNIPICFKTLIAQSMLHGYSSVIYQNLS
jgi:hypothetical protein